MRIIPSHWRESYAWTAADFYSSTRPLPKGRRVLHFQAWAYDVNHPLQIHHAANETPIQQRKLRSIMRELDGLPQHVVVNMMLSLCVEAVAQQNGNVVGATALFDEATWKAKQFLLAHYNPIGGKKFVEVAGGMPILRN